MQKKLAISFVLIVIILGGYFIYQDNKNGNQVKVADNYYENLRKQCEVNYSDDNQKSCCLDSVKAMEVVGSVKLFPGGKYEESGEYQCPDGLKRMTLRCPGSYVWCQTSSNPEGENFVPIPKEVPTINPGPGYDGDKVNPPRRREGALGQGNGPVCTMEAKKCPDGTFVGRTGLNCEFAKCPGEKLKPEGPLCDGVVSGAMNIVLPKNVMTVKECANAGGEVFNTLGQTTYDGELIGKINELRCPCACLVNHQKMEQ